MTRILIKKAWRDHVEEMIFSVVNQKKLPFKTVLMDSWYGTQRLMALVDNEGKNLLLSLKNKSSSR
ncbi:MAG: hypothetical protein F6K17_40850 [Okeania sp. SIO3C4]|nr:hypothetical protein [Okeania sp. SIO3C4]